jgi:hypothetical protein
MARHDSRRYSATMPHGYGLQNFVDFLVEIANEGEFDKQGRRRLTEEECKLLHRHGELLSGNSTLPNHPGVVAELVEMLVDRQPAPVQEYRLHKLWQAMGSACVIASYQAENPDARKIWERAARATAGKVAKSQLIDEIIAAVAEPICRKHTTWPPWRIAGEIRDSVNARLKAQGDKPLGQRAIATRVGKLHERPFVQQNSARTSVRSMK